MTVSQPYFIIYFHVDFSVSDSAVCVESSEQSALKILCPYICCFTMLVSALSVLEQYIISFSTLYMTYWMYGLWWCTLLWSFFAVRMLAIQCVLAFCSKARTVFSCHITCTTSCVLSSIFHSACMCAHICCEPVFNVYCREDPMPFSCVLRAAILLLLTTLPPRWRGTSLTLMMLDTQPCTGQPMRVSCPWWSTSWDPVALMSMQGTRLAYIVCCLSLRFGPLLDTPAAWPQ